MLDTLLRSTYSFPLSPDLIAQQPSAERGGSRLFVLPRWDGPASHRSFTDLPDLLVPGDLLVLNDTRVLSARVLLRRATGGGVPGLLLEAPTSSAAFPIMLEGRGKLSAGDVLAVVDIADDREAGSVRLEASLGGGVWSASVRDEATCDALQRSGRMPLPPYIRRTKRGPDPLDEMDRHRYQTVFATHEGAVAAPTAGLHFTDELLARLEAIGIDFARVTLHVGPGTFMPIRADDLREHRMHQERFHVPEETAAKVALARQEGRRVIAVGTTVVRTLEAAFDDRSGALVAGDGETDLFIHPPFAFRVVDAMITNFHLPESTLLMLVAAFCGRERLLGAYGEAVEARYRFFSYGDAMFVDGPGR